MAAAPAQTSPAFPRAAHAVRRLFVTIAPPPTARPTAIDLAALTTPIFRTCTPSETHGLRRTAETRAAVSPACSCKQKVNWQLIQKYCNENQAALKNSDATGCSNVVPVAEANLCVDGLFRKPAILEELPYLVRAASHLIFSVLKSSCTVKVLKILLKSIIIYF